MKNDLKKLAKLVRYYILLSSTSAGSGHPTSSLSATELMTALMFGGFFKYDIKKPDYHNNDRLIFSKGHASPLFYGLWAAAKGSSINEKELKTFRKFTSRLEGHPTLRLPYTEAATGSLGQGLSIGVGMALNAQLDKLSYKTYVLLGDSEMAEGSNWEAMQLAAYYKLNNLIGIIDVNRLGQRGETMHGHDIKDYVNKAKAFGWEAIAVDGHNLRQVKKAYSKAVKSNHKPVMIIAKTIKGKGVSFIADKNGWHGKALKQDDYNKAIIELGKINKDIRGIIAQPKKIKSKKLSIGKLINVDSDYTKPLATRKAYGHALLQIAKHIPEIVVLDAEVSNSTYAADFKDKYPDKFFEMFIAEQNMVGTALGLSRRGKIPFVSTFAAFFARAADQIRMSQYSDANIKFVGSHAGVSIGVDGSSQMALEDISLFRSVNHSVVLYPSDHISTEKLILAAAKYKGMVYIRTTRADTNSIYNTNNKFSIGGSHVVRSDKRDVVTVVTAGITLHEALKAYKILKQKNIHIRVIDLYSIKPLDIDTLVQAVQDTHHIITVEDHYSEGGIGEAVSMALSGVAHVHSLAVHKMPRSGQPEQLLKYENIDSDAIIRLIQKLT